MVRSGCAIGWRTVGPDEVGLLRRFDRFRGLLGPGLHTRWPFPFERVMTFRPDRIQSLEIGFRAPALEANEPLRWESTHGRAATGDPDGPALLLTGDDQYVEVAATLQFAIGLTGRVVEPAAGEVMTGDLNAGSTSTRSRR
jgi:modulator of FtsH protease HflK